MNQNSNEWFSDEAFWIASHDTTFPAARFNAAAAEVEQILALIQLDDGGEVLDLACGPGRHSIPLAQRGFTVTGVDQSQFLLERARSRSAQEGVSVEWVKADMREFLRPEAFDLA